jgi:hypothetical protein
MHITANKQATGTHRLYEGYYQGRNWSILLYRKCSFKTGKELTSKRKTMHITANKRGAPRLYEERVCEKLLQLV